MQVHKRTTYTFTLDADTTFHFTTPTGSGMARTILFHGDKITTDSTVEVIGQGISKQDGSPLSIDRRGYFKVAHLPNRTTAQALINATA